MRLKWKLTVASTKMFFRQKEAIVWTLLFPLFIVVLFGFVKFDGIGRMHLGVVNEAGANGAQLLGRLSAVKTFEIAEGPRDAEVAALGKGERDIVLVIPKGFTPGGAEALTAYADPEARPRETQLAVLVLQRVLDEDAFAAAPQVRRSIVSMEPVKTRNLTYMDFLLPGVLSMSIMQMGIFGVAFSFVSLKKRGILRRLWVTPINPSDFIFAQVATRLLTLMVQMTVMIGVGFFFLHLHFIGNFLVLYLLGILGAVVFLGDSITEGWKTLAKDFPDLKVVNRGIGGDTTRGVLYRLNADVLALKPAAVVLLIGINDIGLGGKPEDIADNTKAILLELKRSNPHMPVIVCKVMPSSTKQYRPADKIEQLNALVDEIVKANPQCIRCDTWSIYAGPDGDCQKDEFPDLLHPNAIGYAKWANALKPIFAQLNLGAEKTP